MSTCIRLQKMGPLDLAVWSQYTIVHFVNDVHTNEHTICRQTPFVRRKNGVKKKSNKSFTANGHQPAAVKTAIAARNAISSAVSDKVLSVKPMVFR